MRNNVTSLETLTSVCGIECVPASWQAHWPGYARWSQEDSCKHIQWQLTEQSQRVFDLPDEATESIESGFMRITDDPPLRQLIEFWHYLVYHLPGEIGENSNTWKLPDPLRGVPARLLYLLAILSGADHAIENFQIINAKHEILNTKQIQNRNSEISNFKLQISTSESSHGTICDDEVIVATLSYIGAYVRDMKLRRGAYGLESMSWLRNYVRAEVFRLGRLTFRQSPYPWPFRAFKHRCDGRVIWLCDGGRYRRDGLADGTNGVSDPDAWLPQLNIGETGIRGCPVSADGRAVRKPVELPIAQWQALIGPGDQRVEVHVAGGCRLDADACHESFVRALEFFASRDGSKSPAVFTCVSWLLDPNLAAIMPAESNIIQFQRRFIAVPLCGDQRQTLDLVFGDPSVDPTKLPARSSLQRAIQKHLRGGGLLRSAGGVIPWARANQSEKKSKNMVTITQEIFV